jgi:uncharacterized protein (TIGR03067 family)
MRARIAVGLAIGMLVTAGAVIGSGAAKSADTLQGTWTLSAGEANGVSLSAKQIQGGKLVITGDHYSVTLDGGEAITGVQKLGVTSGTKTIDITNANGADKDKSFHGIYELKGNEFRVAFAAAGKPRPTQFTSTPDSGTWIHVWQRAKE